MKKSHIAMFGILFILIIIYLIKIINPGGYTSAGDIPELKFPQRNKIDLITIKHSIDGEKIKLKRENPDSEWKILFGKENEIQDKANQRTANKILSTVQNIKLVSIKSRNQNKYINYEVDDDSGVFVEVISSETGEKIEFIVGGTDVNEKYTFIRIPDKKPVFSTLNNIREIFNKKFLDLRERVLLTFDWRDITEITFKSAEYEPMTIKKTGVEDVPDDEFNIDKHVKWEIGETGLRLNPFNVHNAIRNIWNLHALEFLDNPTKEQLNYPVIFEADIHVKEETENEEEKEEVYNLKVLRPSEEMISEKSDKEEIFKSFSIRHLIQINDRENPLYWVNKVSIKNFMQLNQIHNLLKNRTN